MRDDYVPSSSACFVRDYPHTSIDPEHRPPLESDVSQIDFEFLEIYTVWNTKIHPK